MTKIQSTQSNPIELIIEYLLLLILLIAPLVYYPYIKDFSHLPKTAFIQISCCLLLLVLTLNALRAKQFEYAKNPLLFPIVIWLFYCGVSIIWATNHFSGFLLWLHWLVCSFVFIIVTHSFHQLTRIDRIFAVCAISGGIISIIGLLQYLFGMDFIPQAFIPGATFSNRNVAAQFIVMVMPFSFLCAFISKKKRWKGLYILLSLTNILFLICTKTRSAWMAIIFSVFVAAVILIAITDLRQRIWNYIGLKRKYYFILFILLLIAGVSLSPYYLRMHLKPSETQKREQIVDLKKDLSYKEILLSMSQYKGGGGGIRVAMWRNSLEVFKNNLLLGVGLGNWYIHYPIYQDFHQKDTAFSVKHQPVNMHNDLLQMLTETSVPGVVLFLAMLFFAFKQLFKILFSTIHPDIKLRALFCGMSLLGFLVVSFFSFPMRMAIPPLFLMVNFGIAAVLNNSVQGSPEKSFAFKSRISRLSLVTFLIAVLIGTTLINIRQLRGDHHFLRSKYFLKSEKWNFAKEEAFQATVFTPWQHKSWFILGSALQNLGLMEDTISAYQKVLEHHPNHLNSLLELGETYFEKKDYPKAEYWIKKALDIKSDIGSALFNMGLIKEAQKEHKASRNYYLQATQASSKMPEAYFRLGVSYLMEGDLKQSRKMLEKTLKLKPNHKGLHFQLGTVYSRLNMLKEAHKEFQKELQANPKNAKAHTNLGLVYGRQNNLKKAIKSFKKAIALDPKLGEAHMNLAFAYYQNKKYAQSLKHAKISEQLNIPQAKILIKKLNPYLR